MATYFIGTSWGGGAIPQHFNRLGQELAAKGHQAVIVVDHQRHEDENHESNPAIYTWPSWRPTRLRDAIFFAKLIDKYRPDCLIANFGSENVMTVVGWLMNVHHRVVWYHTMQAQIDRDWRGSTLKKEALRKRKRIVLNLATLIGSNSNTTLLDAVANYSLKRKNCTVFPYSLPDPSLDLKPANQREGACRVVCVGRLDQSKGQDTLIRSVALLTEVHPELIVEFVGDGEARECLQKLACDLGIENQCFFAGALPRQEIFAKMASAIITVVPSLSEAFGIVNIESMAVGTPVIASAVGGIPEIVRDRVDGFLVPPGDPAALAEKLRTLIENPELRAEMGRNARERFLTTFEQTEVVKHQAEFFEQLVVN